MGPLLKLLSSALDFYFQPIVSEIRGQSLYKKKMLVRLLCAGGGGVGKCVVFKMFCFLLIN